MNNITPLDIVAWGAAIAVSIFLIGIAGGFVFGFIRDVINGDRDGRQKDK